MRLVEWLLDRLPWKRIAAFATVLYRSKRWALVLSATLFVTSVAFAVWYWQRSTAYEKVVRETLSAEMMPTPQSRKGLEAFLMSGLPTNLDKRLRESSMSDEFISELRRLATVKAPTLNAPDLKLVQGNGGVVFTDDQPHGFLFLPSQILRPTLSPQQIQELESSPEGPAPDFVAAAVKSDPELVRDVNFTAALMPILHRLSTISVTGDPDHEPVQVYVITKNGVNRIFNGDVGRRSIYQFPETTFFPSRPYFWPTFDRQKRKYSESVGALAPRPGVLVEQYFEISQPYMDLGGSGLVVTLSRGLWAPGFPRAALCFDVRLELSGESTLERLLAQRIRELGGSPMVVECDTEGKQIECNPHSNERRHDMFLLRQMQRTLKQHQQKQQRAQILGNVQVFPEANDAAIRGSIPFGPVGANGAEGRFLLFKLDLVSHRRLTSAIGIAAASALGAMTLLLAYLWGSQMQHREEYEQAFSRVAQVMCDSPTPYVRLAANDLIRDLSGSFLELLRYSAADAKDLKQRTFRSLLADEESAEAYDRIQERRLSGGTVQPYFLNLRAAHGDPVAVRVVSADIPSDTPGMMPETFGILVAVDDLDRVSGEHAKAARLFITKK